jgi:hypothetical protein
MGPGNTFLRNEVQGEGIFLNDHSHKQNFVGNISTRWKDDGTSKQTLRHGELVNGITIWASSINDHTIPASYYLESKPAFYGSMDWPSIGYDKLGGIIPSWKRWKSGKMLANKHEKKINVKRKSDFKVQRHFDTFSIILQTVPAAKNTPHIMITDLTGKTMQIKIYTLSKKRGDYRIEFKNMPPASGAYIIHVQNGVDTVSKKVMIANRSIYF